MKITKCYYCGSGQHTFYAEENGYHLVKCDICGLLYVQDRPGDSEISQANKQGIHGGRNSFDVTGVFEPDKILVYLKVLEDLSNGDMIGNHTWLDVGCGHGEFMMAVQKYSAGKVDVTGSEPNARKQQSALQRGLRVGYFEIESHAEKYDTISLLNVYSHLPDPPAFLSSLKRLLRPNGEIVLETGNTAGLSAKDHYRPFYLADHLSFASESIVTGILRRLDFEILCVRKYSFLRFDLNRFAREMVKAVLPQYQSKLRYFVKRSLYSETDMYIRARLKS